MGAKLIAEKGPLKGLVLTLEEGDQWLIGRDPDQCQLLVEDPAASRKHLICRKTPEGIVVENLSQSNPVEVNGETFAEPRLLHEGDAVKIGDGIFRFYTDADATQNRQPNEDTGDKMEETDNELSEANNRENSAPLNPSEQGDDPTHERPNPEEGHETIVDASEAEASVIPNEPAPDAFVQKYLSPAPNLKDDQDDRETEDSIFQESAVDGLDSALANIDFDLLESGRWFIKVISGPNTGAEFAMQSGAEYLFGTDPATCDIVFHDASVSRQHARIKISPEDILTIEDLKSRNGTIVGDDRITEPHLIPSNTVVTLGTTAFVVLDREGKRDTIISPLLPSIVKVLQRDDARRAEEQAAKSGAPTSEVPLAAATAAASAVEEKKITPEKSHFHYTALILMAMVTGILVVAGIGTTTLFRTKEITAPQVNYNDKIKEALAAFPVVKSSFNPNTGELLLVGHVLTQVEMTQLLYNLQSLSFIKNINNNVIIDEYVWQEINQVIAKNPDWRGITIHSPAAGHFVLTGYLKTRKQADQLSDYLSQNFQYLDLLEKRIVVEEDVLTQINVNLQEHGIRGVAVQMSNGEVALSGAVGGDKTKDLDQVIVAIKNIPGVRVVSNYVVQQAPEQSVVDLSSQYAVTGYSNQGDVNVSVIINGRILSRGDTLDGMTITSIKPTAVFLEKDNVKYRIDYNK